MEFEGIFNFRDLGGIEAEDGRKVKKGMFFRSARLDDATEADVKYLKELGIKTVFDYRTPKETRPKAAEISAAIGARYLTLSAAVSGAPLFKLDRRSPLYMLTHRFTGDEIALSYSAMPFNNPAYKRMAATLLEGGEPFLQHCTAGKDRTGVGVAILLLILGVPYESVLADYLESQKISERLARMMLGQYIRSEKTYRRLAPRYAPLFGVSEKFLGAFRSAILERYGTFENYFEKEFGISAQDLSALRDKYLE